MLCTFNVSVGAMALASASLSAQETERVSLDSSGGEAHGRCDQQSISADGRFVAFWSDTGLVPADTNGYWDIYVRDRLAGTTTIASVDADGSIGLGNSDTPCISDDGRFVAFTSFRSGLIPGDTNGVSDLFLRDLVGGTTERVSVGSGGFELNDRSYGARLSADSTLVAFMSYATNAVANDGNGQPDIFVRDRLANTTTRVSMSTSGGDSDGHSDFPTISADARFVAFDSFATNLVIGDTNGREDVFVCEVATGETTRVSVDSSGTDGDGDSGRPAISADGRYVAFVSLASNLVPNDSNGDWDVFVRDLVAGTTERVSVDSSGSEGDGGSNTGWRLSMNADGRYVEFASYAANLDVGDANGVADVFVRDRVLQATRRVSVATDGSESNGESLLGAISADGRFVAFSSTGDNLVSGDVNGAIDVFVRGLCDIDATWSNYGSGFPGTNGVPGLTSEADPVLGSQLTVDLDNSLGGVTVGLMLFGYQEANILTGKGGEILVVPAITVLVALAPGGTSLAGDIPDDVALCGFELFGQAVELDPGAARGMSFTPGLKLILGH